ncbi:unnamed protein product [Merluccius merluccius]
MNTHRHHQTSLVSTVDLWGKLEDVWRRVDGASSVESAVGRRVEERFCSRDRTFCRSQALRFLAFEREVGGQHVHLLLEKEAAQYRNSRVVKHSGVPEGPGAGDLL